MSSDIKNNNPQAGSENSWMLIGCHLLKCAIAIAFNTMYILNAIIYSVPAAINIMIITIGFYLFKGRKRKTDKMYA